MPKLTSITVDQIKDKVYKDKFFHYKIYNIEGKRLADGFGNLSRLKTIMSAATGKIPGTKHMKSFVMYMSQLNNMIGDIVIDVYDSKKEATAAEAASHKANGTPICSAMITEMMEARATQLDTNYSALSTDYPMLYSFTLMVAINGDNFTNSGVCKFKRMITSASEQEFFGKFFAL